MRQTPAQRSFMMKLAAMQQANDQAITDHGQTVGNAFELQMAQLHQHKRTLKDMHSVELKIAAKAKLLPEYDAYVDGVLQARPGTQDEVIATVLVWHIDAGNFERAMQIAEYALACGMTPPDSYERNLPTVLQDEVSAAILGGKLVGESAVTLAKKVMELTQNADTPDQPKAKLCKAAGWAILGKTSSTDVKIQDRTKEQCAEALPFLLRAMELDKNIGVKKDIERLERKVSNPS